ncbi:uncharacterized protein M6G45_004104 isoform 2-T2 [Spheniscus humboldti]
MTMFIKIFNRTDTWGCGSEGNRDAAPQLHSLLLVPKMLSCHCAALKGDIFTGMALPAQADTQTSGEWRNLPARNNRGEYVGSSPSVAEKGGLNKGLPNPEGVS